MHAQLMEEPAATTPEPQFEAVEKSPFAVDPLEGMLQRVWLRTRRRKAWLDSLNRTPAEMSHGDYFNDPDAWSGERAWQQSSEGRVWRDAIAVADRWLECEAAVPLQRLKKLFRLSDSEADLLQASVALRIDPALGPVFGYLEGNNQRTFLTGPLAARLFGENENPLPWRPGETLDVWRFVHAGESSTGEAEPLVSDPIIPRWLAGEAAPDASLGGILRSAPARVPLSNWPHESLASIIDDSLTRRVPLRVVITGPKQSGRATLATCALQRLGWSAAQADTDLIEDRDWPETFLRIQRFARWTGLALIWRGTRLDRAWPGAVEPSPVQILVRERDQTIASRHGFVDHFIKQPRLTLADKTRLWQEHCAAFAGWDFAEQRRLTGSYRLHAGQIVAIGSRDAATPAEAAELAREATRNDLGELGQLLPCSFGWKDIVLKAPAIEALRDLAYEAQERAEFWENPEARRLFPRGKGLTALFTGDPGTGKTMAAQIIATELQLDLYRIDLARVVSKYIGETAKHLREIFVQAAEMSAILLFDEADALFAKRTDVRDSHDRYANADTGYLLQLLEEYRGLAILTTNKRGNVDPAFFRRLRYVFDFPKPGPEERLQIWRRIMGGLFGIDTACRLEPAAALIAQQVEVSAAQIKNALLASVFIARRQDCEVRPNHLVLGLDRELAKEGRSAGQHIRNELF
jgi:ATPase family associated with various cellular activities (AAA)